MALGEHAKNRLENWKFASAYAALFMQDRDGSVTSITTEHNTVRALSEVFGNCGWFEGDSAYSSSAAPVASVSASGSRRSVGPGMTPGKRGKVVASGGSREDG